MDFDLDVGWPLDQIQFLSNPTSPPLFSPTDHPCSPLWAFSDVNEDKLAGGGQALPDRPQFVPGEFLIPGRLSLSFALMGCSWFFLFLLRYCRIWFFRIPKPLQRFYICYVALCICGEDKAK